MKVLCFIFFFNPIFCFYNYSYPNLKIREIRQIQKNVDKIVCWLSKQLINETIIVSSKVMRMVPSCLSLSHISQWKAVMQLHVPIHWPQMFADKFTVHDLTRLTYFTRHTGLLIHFRQTINIMALFCLTFYLF